MSKNEIGYRGSKSGSVVDTLLVKEQRVYGNLLGRLTTPSIRCTLKGFERNCRVGILSNQISPQAGFCTFARQLYPTCVASLENYNLPAMLNPWWFTGFIDGEGYFSIGISKNKNKVG